MPPTRLLWLTIPAYLCGTLMLAGLALGQDGRPKPRANPASAKPDSGKPATAKPKSTVSQSGKASAVLAEDDIRQAIGGIDNLKDLDADGKTALRSTYEQILTDLKTAATFDAERAGFRKREKDAPSALTAARAERDAPKARKRLNLRDSDLQRLQDELKAVELEVRQLREKEAVEEGEPQRRAAQAIAIPTEIQKLKASLEDLKTKLAAPPPANEKTWQRDARLTALRGQQLLLDARRQRLEAELAAYTAEKDLPQQRRLVLVNQIGDRQDYIDKLNNTISEKKEKESDCQLKQAQDEVQRIRTVIAENSLPKPDARTLTELANANLELARRRKELAGSYNELTQQMTRVSDVLTSLNEEFTRTKQRVQTQGTSTTVGLLLRRRRNALPDALTYRRSAAARQPLIREANNDVLDLEEARLRLANLEAVVKETLAPLRRQGEDAAVNVVTSNEVRNLAKTQLQLVDKLTGEQDSYFHRLIEITTSEQDVARRAREYRNFIDKHILWVRSTHRIGLADLRHSRDSLYQLLDGAAWRRVGLVVSSDVRGNYWIHSAVLIGLLVWGVYAGRLRRLVTSLGDTASRRGQTSFRPTLRTTVLTTALGSAIPLTMIFAGWRLFFSGGGDMLVSSLGNAIWSSGVVLLPVELFRQVCRRNGLAESHFEWPVRALQVLRNNLGWAIYTWSPLVFFATFFTGRGRDTESSALGRLCLIATLLTISLFMYRLLRPRSGALLEALALNPNGWLNRLRYVWYPLAIVAPMALAVLASAGYEYTARKLTLDLLYTLGLIVGLTVLGGLLLRWLLLSRRAMTIQQARQRRATEANLEEAALAVMPADSDDQVNVTRINAQTRQLIQSLLIISGVVGAIFIWSSVFPALDAFDKVKIWQIDGDVPGTKVPITLKHLLFVIPMILVTWLAAKNLPGLMELALLQHLPLDNAVRYAITTLASYAIVVLGSVFVFTIIGFRWNSIQWLVAAMGVGLGFGMQEIFASAFSGVIILFEQPIRVGDIVTLGDITGVVSRIRIRATTITNWDRKEYIVPNKDILTGRLLNWTLSDTTNRVVVTVGVAYSSDVRMVTELLKQILTENENIMAEPGPLVTFESFGDSTLNFTIRAYLGSLDNRLSTVHDLHTIILERFRQQDIEIAFPQRDVNLHLDPVAQQALAASQLDHSQS